MIIDSHLHVWSDDPQRYPWAGDGPSQDGSVELLLQTMERHGVDKACLVQSIHYLFDNRYTADCLARYPGRFSGIAVMDRNAPDAVERLERLVTEDGFEGLRMHLSRADDPAEWGRALAGPDLAQGRELGACFLSFGPGGQAAGRRADHRPPPGRAGGPGPPGRRPVRGRTSRAAAPQRPRPGEVPERLREVHAAGRAGGRPLPVHGPARGLRADLRRLRSAAPDVGTDFPHIFADIGYRRGLELFRDHMAFLTEEDKRWLFAETAKSIWKFRAPKPAERPAHRARSVFLACPAPSGRLPRGDDWDAARLPTASMPPRSPDTIRSASPAIAVASIGLSSGSADRLTSGNSPTTTATASGGRGDRRLLPAGCTAAADPAPERPATRRSGTGT